MLDKVVNVRLTAAALEAIDQVRGTRTRAHWVRDVVDSALLDGRTSTEPIRTVVSTPIAGPDVVEVVEIKNGAGETVQTHTHRHRYDQLISDKTVRGVRHKTERCACGEERTT